jgi:hypothetical protein
MTESYAAVDSQEWSMQWTHPDDAAWRAGLREYTGLELRKLLEHVREGFDRMDAGGIDGF